MAGHWFESNLKMSQIVNEAKVGKACFEPA